MIGLQTVININGEEHITLKDILPNKPGLKILFVAKTPAPISVSAGHYFQGTQGSMFWNKLKEFKIINVPYGEFEDEYLLENQYGITDIVKKPRGYGNEPSDEEYRAGLSNILNLIKLHKPKVIVFVYKKVLDQILKFGFKIYQKSKYGFNIELEKHFDSKVFVFPMPGTPCRREDAHDAMQKLSLLINVITK